MNAFNNFIKTLILIFVLISGLHAAGFRRLLRNSSTRFENLRLRLKYQSSRVNHTRNTTERGYGFRDHFFLVATAAHYPWVASLQKEGFHQEEYVWRHKCTTCILNELWTITACHCVAYMSEGGGVVRAYYPGDHRVVGGTTQLGALLTRNVKIRQVEKFVYSTHCWKDNMHQSNYGGVKLKVKLSFSQFIRPLEYVSVEHKRITMVLHRLQKNKTTCHVVGWGLTYVNGTDLLTMSRRVSVDQYSISVQQKSDRFCDDTLCKRHPIYCESGRSQARSELCAVPLKSDSAYLPTSGSCLVCGRYSFGILSWVYGSDSNSPAVYFFSRFDKPFNFSDNEKNREIILRTRSNNAFSSYATSNILYIILIFWITRSLLNKTKKNGAFDEIYQSFDHKVREHLCF